VHDHVAVSTMHIRAYHLGVYVQAYGGHIPKPVTGIVHKRAHDTCFT